MSLARFREMEKEGTILPGMSSWRTVGGAAFKIVVERNWRLRHLLSRSSMASCHDITILMFGLCMIVFVFAIPQLRESIIHDLQSSYISGAFFCVLLVATISLSLVTMRKKARELALTASEIGHTEV